MEINKSSDNRFEKSVNELEVIIKRLEEGNLTIDESLKEFQRGIELYKSCYNMINNIEGKIKIILENEDGYIVEDDFLKDK